MLGHTFQAMLCELMTSANLLLSRRMLCMLTPCSILPAGADQAVHWLLQHEADPQLQDPLPGMQPPPALSAAPTMHFAPSAAGVAGILRREQEMAAQSDA